MAKKLPPSPDSPQTFTSTKRVKELVALMAENGLTEIELAEDKSRIVLRRGTTSGGTAVQPQAMQWSPPPAPQAAPPPAAAAAPAAPAQDAGLVPINSPMVGTFYAAAGPDSDAYVSVGSPVDEKTTVCIIEAMKTFNQIHAETRGTIAKVLVSNGQLIEFGQPLFMVKPN